MARTRNKIPHVSLYPNRRTGRWELAYSIDGQRRVERLGVVEAHARQRAQEVSNLIDKKASKLITNIELNRLVKDRVPLEKHLANYIAWLEAQDAVVEYRDTLKTRIETWFDTIGARRLDHLTAAAIERALPTIRQLEGRGGERISGETVRHYLKALRRFLNWCVRQGFVLHNPMVTVPLPAVGEVRHKRRPPSDEELRYLLAWLDQQTTPYRAKDTSGADRAMFYRVLVTTGLRVGEVLAVTTDMLSLDRGARIVVPGHLTKNGHEADQPLPDWLGERLKTWLGSRTGPLFLRMGAIGHTFEKDLERCRAAWIDEVKEDPQEHQARSESTFLKRKIPGKGIWDLHSFRHYYVTRLVRSGVTVKDAQALARHANAELTIGTYSHAQDQLGPIVNKAFEKL